MQVAIDMVREAARSAGPAVTYDALSASETHATVFQRAVLNVFRRFCLQATWLSHAIPTRF
ncbi:hypothetical protein [Henriciella marina]|uniref:hypothetical protein n=1 Tax=Henriciella marina TaxID=453851 RepID=UPI00036A7109|nr:hypothetical protein [Henriciella marina]